MDRIKVIANIFLFFVIKPYFAKSDGCIVLETIILLLNRNLVDCESRHRSVNRDRTMIYDRPFVMVLLDYVLPSYKFDRSQTESSFYALSEGENS
jgi:hypothetical protein